MQNLKVILSKIITIQSSIIFLNKYIYSIGLSQYGSESQRRHRIFNPIFIAIVNVLLIIRELVTLIFNNENLSIIFGDFAIKWKFKVHWSVVVVLTIILVTNIQILDFWYYYLKQNNYWLISPYFNENSTTVLGKKSKLFFKFVDTFTKKIFPLFAFTISFVFLSIFTNSSLKELIIFGIPWSIIYWFFGLYDAGIIIWLFIYFALISYNCKLRVKIQNCMLRGYLFKSHRIKAKSIKSLLNNFDKIHIQINRLNHFWSKFLFWNWMIYSIIIVLLLFQICFGKLDMSVFIFFAFLSFIGITFLIILLIAATAVYNENKITHQLSQRLMVATMQNNISISIKLKVN